MKREKRISYTIDYINPTKETNPSAAYVPAFRGQDQLNIYTDTYIYQTKDHFTGTNPWGIEAAVDKNHRVIAINDRVKIPEGGFVISGNSKGQNFISENIELGAIATYNPATMKLELSINLFETTLYSLKVKIKQIKKRIHKAIQDIVIFNQEMVLTIFNEIQNLYKKLQTIAKGKSHKNDRKFFIYKQQILDKIDIIYELTTRSSMLESRGVWYRPHETTLKEIQKTLDVMKKCNLNVLYVETFYNGSIIGKSNITTTNEDVIHYHDTLHRHDYLNALIDEAHLRDIEVHAWVENFFVGESIKFDKNYPDDFRMINYNGSTIQGPNDGNSEIVENGFIFLDPAHPKVQNYILSIYKELIENYNLDGFHIDYVRYPHGNLNLETSNGYSLYAMNEFKKRYGYSPKEDVRKLVLDPKIYQEWVHYRCNKITQFVKKVHHLIKSVRPNCKISMAVVPETTYAIQNKMQDWVPWVKKGWIDITLPMAYYFGTSEIEKSTRSLVKLNQLRAYSYTGILPNYKNAKDINNTFQIEACINNHAQGYSIFQLEDFLHNKNRQKILYVGTNRLPATNPHQNFMKIKNAYLNELLLKYSFYQLRQPSSYDQYLKQLKELTDAHQAIVLISNYLNTQAKKDLHDSTYLSFKKQTQFFLKILKIHQYQETKNKK